MVSKAGKTLQHVHSYYVEEVAAPRPQHTVSVVSGFNNLLKFDFK